MVVMEVVMRRMIVRLRGRTRTAAHPDEVRGELHRSLSLWMRGPERNRKHLPICASTKVRASTLLVLRRGSPLGRHQRVAALLRAVDGHNARRYHAGVRD